MNRKMIAAFLILACTALAAVFACQSPGPATHKVGGGLDYAPPGAAPMTTWCAVPSPCIGNIQTSGLYPGAMAFAYSTKTWYYLDPSSTATPDNSATFAAKNGTTTLGNWVLLQPSVGGGLQDGAGSGNETIIAINADSGTTLLGANVVNNLVVLTGTINANFQLTVPNNVGQCWYIDTFNVVWAAGKAVIITTGSDAAGYASILSADAGSLVFQKTLFQACVTEPSVVTLM